ncbi:hypothetical protein DJ564_10265 [Pseudomonas sp. 31-12]|uniref:hypothetical protein n=1 Tax=Pseudomonas sp. 31-12 TaxID=2201356 RepID=UPI000D6C5A7D|nr:hypothetical protein [Pseudomonas sp. 31-12]AWM91179.1 hypothetical protein DJ564_10265 [Pseudomonas sp. 31-12]
MTKTIEITINTCGVTEKVSIECDRKNLTLFFTTKNGFRKTYTAHDLYECFGLLRADFPEINFLCKGAKLNVYPSRMASQMAGGIVAYELQMGKPAETEDVVNIFDFEDKDITTDIQQQRDFYKRWLASFAH